MNPASLLHRLQLIDTRIDLANNRKKEIDDLLANDEEVRQAKEKLDNSQLDYQKAADKMRDFENKVADSHIKKEQSEAALYGGTIRNPKELQDLQKEIHSLANRITYLEEQQLEAMMETEQLQNQVSDLQKNLHQAQAKVMSRQAGLAGERSTQEKNLLRYSAERQAALEPIPSHILETYNKLRETRSGLAVSQIDENACSACGTEVRQAEVQAIRSAQTLMFCKLCGRILYAA